MYILVDSDVSMFASTVLFVLASVMSLYRLMYLSRRTQPDDSSELVDIISHARISNREKGITGILLSSREYFLQVMEGRVAVLSQTIEKIFNDPRHSDIRLVLFHQVPHRLFEKWSMGELGVVPTVFENSSHTPLVEHLMIPSSKTEMLIGRDDLEQLFLDFMGLSESNQQLAEHL
jgi:hypothetical protein